MAAVAAIDADMGRMARASAACSQLMTLPGVGQLTSLAFVAAVDDPSRIRRSRTSAPIWLGPQACAIAIARRGDDELERATVANHRRDPGQPAGGERPRRRRARRFGDSGQRARSARLQIRPRFRRLPWRDAQAELDRRQGETRLDRQAGQSLYPTASGVGRRLGLAGGAKAQGRVVRLAGRPQSAKPAKVVAVALAKKLARIVWAIITTGEAFRSSIYAKA